MHSTPQTLITAAGLLFVPQCCICSVRGAEEMMQAMQAGQMLHLQT